jgi:hypothetical protein
LKVLRGVCFILVDTREAGIFDSCNFVAKPAFGFLLEEIPKP